MNIKIFADGADKAEMLELANNPRIAGLTTNPTLLRKAGVKDYKIFALDILSVIKDKPISFEVIADDNYEMYRQGVEISSWGQNVYVKIPITNTKGETTYQVIESLSQKGIKLNITAITTIKQVRKIIPALKTSPGAYISIFAGRIADTGINPLPIMKSALNVIKNTNIELIWASPREVYNVIQAEEIGCHIITCTNDIIKKLFLIGKDLTEYSLDTVKLFFNDAKESGLKL
jgi:transaldolase